MFGPDGNLFLNPGLSKFVTIPAGSSFSIGGTFNAANEIAVIVYDAINMTRVFAFGNFSRQSLGLQGLPSSANFPLILTAWHKNSPPNPTGLWFQSRTRLRGRGTGSRGTFTFTADDGANDNDFDDAVVTIRYP